jgi:hypothetical protein
MKINYDTGARAKHARRLSTRLPNGERRLFNFSPENTASPLVFDSYAWSDAREHWTKPTKEGRRLYVGGLSDICDQEFVNAEMRRLFEGHNIQAVSKRVLPVHRNMEIAATGQCYCFVDLPSAIDAEAAMAALNGTPTPYGGLYRIKVAYDQQDRKVCREQLGFGNGTVTGEMKRNLNGNWRSRI